MTKFKTICVSAAFLSFVAGSAFAAAPPNTVQLLFSSFITTTGIATAQVTRTFGPFTSNALVFLASNGTATGSGNAGAVVQIKKDGVVIAADDSADDVSSP